MIQKPPDSFLKGFFFGMFTIFSFVCEAQTTRKNNKDTLHDKSADTAALTISQVDSAKIKATVINLRTRKDVSDTTMSSLLLKIETLVIQLNKDIALLHRGFDTLEIGEKIPLLETGLDRLQASLTRMKGGANIRNLNSIKVALQQTQKLIKRYQETLHDYSELLAKTSENQAKSVADSILNKMPDDTLLRINYLTKLDPLIQKLTTYDSLLTGSVKSIGLLQSRISGSFLKCAELLDEVNVNIKTIQSNLLRKDAPFLFSVNASDRESDLQNINFGFKNNVIISLYYLSLNTGPLVFVLFFGALFFILKKLSVRKLQKAKTPQWDVPLHFLKNNILIPTLLIVFTMLPFIMTNPPSGLVELLWFIMLLIATWIRWKNWPVAFRRLWVGVILAFILFGSDSLLPDTSHTERKVLALLSLGTIALGWAMYREVLKNKDRYHPHADISILIFIIFSVAAFLMNILGWVNLAKLIINTAVLSITLLVALQIIREILLEFLYLQVEAYKYHTLPALAEFNKLKVKSNKMLTAITLILWVMALTWSLSLYDIINNYIAELLSQKRTLGKFEFSYSSILVFIVVIWLSGLAVKLITFIFHGDNSNIVGSDKNKSGSLILFSRLAIYSIGLMLAFAAAGIPTDKITIILGALGVGIGFGLQNIVNNLVSGIILAIEKPMEIGDVIELGTQIGTVKEIGFRSSKISTFDGSVINVPNGDFISQQLINWTYSNNNYRRIEIVAGVKYGSNLDDVKRIIHTIIQEDADVAKFPEPSILVNEFSADAVSIRILFWTADYSNWLGLKSKILQKIYNAFAENGIEIPFSQTDLHIRSIDPEAAEALRGKIKPDNE